MRLINSPSTVVSAPLKSIQAIPASGIVPSTIEISNISPHSRFEVPPEKTSQTGGLPE